MNIDMKIDKQVKTLEKVLDKMMKSFDSNEDKIDFILDVCNGYKEELVKEDALLHNVSNQRELLIAYEIKMRCCTDEQAEQIVDSYLAIKNFCN